MTAPSGRSLMFYLRVKIPKGMPRRIFDQVAKLMIRIRLSNFMNHFHSVDLSALAVVI